MTFERRQTRYVVRLPCRIDLREYSQSAEVVDLSASGARLVLPFAGDTQALWGITSVLIDELGYFDTRVRWQSGNTLGVQFTSPGDRVENYIVKMQLQAVPER
jgi:hypothetical protein